MSSLFYRITIVLLCLALPLFGSSLSPTPMFDDPYSSQKMIEQFDFNRPLDREEKSIADILEVSLITMGKGDELYIWFGHSALAIKDTYENRSVMYDYGIFSFDEDFYQTFALGRLNYEVWATSTVDRIALAREENRDIREITLNLPSESTLELLHLLNYNVTEGHNTYLYHHYRENCSTRIRDLIDAAVGGQFKEWAHSITLDVTLRDLVNRHSWGEPLVNWTLNFLQSGTIDKPITLWEAMFLPSYLEEGVKEFTYLNKEGQRVALATQNINHYTSDSDRFTILEDNSYVLKSTVALFSVALVLILLLSRFQNRNYLFFWGKVSRFLYGFLNFGWAFATGVLSLLLLFMMVMSNHDVTYWNENIIFVNPTLLLYSFFALVAAFGNKKALRGWRKYNSVMSIITLFYIVVKLLLYDFMVQENTLIIVPLLLLYLINSTVGFEKIRLKKRVIIDDSD